MLSTPPPPPPPTVEVLGSGAGVPPPECDTRAAADCTESMIESAIEVNEDRMTPPPIRVPLLLSNEGPRVAAEEPRAVESDVEAVEAVGGWRLAAAGCCRLLAASFASSAAYRRSTASALEMKTGSASCVGERVSHKHRSVILEYIWSLHSHCTALAYLSHLKLTPHALLLWLRVLPAAAKDVHLGKAQVWEAG